MEVEGDEVAVREGCKGECLAVRVDLEAEHVDVDAEVPDRPHEEHHAAAQLQPEREGRGGGLGGGAGWRSRGW